MRRSKSNPARYVRNYRKVSQRRMNDEEDRVEGMLERNLKNTDLSAILAPELLGDDPANELLVLPCKKIKSKTSKAPEITEVEARQAKLMSKNQKRKLAQLEKHKASKAKRAQLYQTLAKHSISQTERTLLRPSSHRGGKETKKQLVQRLFNQEQAGLTLTAQEREILYTSKNDHHSDQLPVMVGQAETCKSTIVVEQSNKKIKTKSSCENIGPETITELMDLDDSGSTEHHDDNEHSTNGDDDVDDNDNDDPSDDDVDDTSDDARDESTNNDRSAHSSPSTATESSVDKSTAKPAISFAQQMMQSLNNLKTKSQQVEEIARQTRLEEQEKKLKKEELEALNAPKTKPYVPSEPIVVQMPASTLSKQQHAKPQLWKSKDGDQQVSKHSPIVRPHNIQQSRLFLPVCEMEYEIVDALRNHDVLIVCGETGSGKSTQVPQFLIEAGYETVGVTQPRRVAAVTTAKRVAYEMSCGNGQTIQRNNPVAYQTRYETAGLGDSTRIKFMTDGVLLQEIQHDLLLRKYSVVILDEAHERNLNTDVLLGLLSAALPLRKQAPELPPLKLVIMSATLRVQDFTSNPRLFVNSTVTLVKVPGRTFPVTIHHSKVTELDDYEQLAFHKVCKIHRSLPPGGILVFVTGKQEIFRLVTKLRRTLNRRKSRKAVQVDQPVDVKPMDTSKSNNDLRDLDDEEVDGDVFGPDTENTDQEEDDEQEEEEVEDLEPVYVLPLHSMLAADHQAKVFGQIPDGHRLIVVATNIAETSITIPGISYVVDTGRVKCRNYHCTTGIATYDVMWISKASADQRAGRAGRTGPGHCYRLYSSSVYDRQFEAFGMPEVLTRPLEDVVLAMKAMKIPNVAKFPFPTAPDPRQIQAALKLLCNIGCIAPSDDDHDDQDGHATLLGRAVAKLPLNVRFGKMLLMGIQGKVLDYAIVIVAILSEQSLFVSVSDEQIIDESEGIAADAAETDSKTLAKSEKRKQWSHPAGDVLAALSAVGAYTFAIGSGENGHEFCHANGLNYVVMERIQKLRLQLAKLAKLRLGDSSSIAGQTGGIIHSMKPPTQMQEACLRQVIVSGLLDNVARLAPVGTLKSSEYALPVRLAYWSCNPFIKEPLWIDRSSFLANSQLPEFVCYESIVRKVQKHRELGPTTVSFMNCVSTLDASWLAVLAKDSPLLKLGEPLNTPPPIYNVHTHSIQWFRNVRYGAHAWALPPFRTEIRNFHTTSGSTVMEDDEYRWFARFLLEGSLPLVGLDQGQLKECWNDSPALITRRKAVGKVAQLVSELAKYKIASVPQLQEHWATSQVYLFRQLRSWTKEEFREEVKSVWIDAVQRNIQEWNMRDS